MKIFKLSIVLIIITFFSMPAWAKFCSECGKPLNDGAKFCSECGASVSFAEQPINEPSQPISENDSIQENNEDFTNKNNNKISIDLKPNTDEYALGAAKVVHDFYFDYFNNMYDKSTWATNKYLSPKTRRIFSMLSCIIWDYDFIIDGQDFGNIWIINKVDVSKDKAIVGLENSWDGEGKRNLKISCKNINGKWFVDDISDVTNTFYSFLNSNSNLAVVTKYDLTIFSNKYKQTKLTFYDRNNRIIPLKNFNTSNNYTIDFAADAPDNLSEKIGFKLLDSDWTIKATDVIPFNFFNKIKKGEDKYMAYIVLGEPREDSSNKLFYSPDDYISYDKDGKITSWNGFEDLKELFDDGSELNNQNIGYVNAKSGINLRKEPNTKSEKVCGLPCNTKVIIMDKNGPQATFEKITSNWFLITDGTRVGWAFGGFIKEN